MLPAVQRPVAFGSDSRAAPAPAPAPALRLRSGSGSGSGSGSPGSGSARPSFVWLLADDLEQDFKQDRKAIMPNLKRALADGGLEFVRAVPRAAALYLCSSFREASSKQVLHR